MLKKFIVVSVVLITLVIVAGLWVWNDYKAYINQPVGLTEKIEFEVKKGSNFNGLVKQLNEVSGPLNEHYFKLYGRQSGLAGKIKAGIYELDIDTTPASFLAAITSGRSISYQFTIIEGSTFKELRARLNDNPHIVDDLKGLNLDQIKAKLSISEHPEGMFLAETYSFDKNSAASTLLKRANKMLIEALDSAWEGKDAALPYKSAYEALIMASIVEKETARPDERPVIAGVFVRRLNKRMRLQTDPTVIYGMGDSYKGNIRRSDLRKPTPYNTYVIPALPPTPIAMVGREAIEASVHPKEGKALYFVAKGDGSHYFSATLKEHNNAVRKYQLNRRKDYRSSP
ncbi:endolytic transglycosylase MltG [Neptuniibacter caesariensis]|uniref:Endolytic murein transglycosylase n=1 Tax=Neptuniibacter caesariensis TaxID=207954 RepID=A0A7U8GQS9_NEPCE|nr:endolytic transglycosylase MltG [Neptuniibacter caesariensis]EAR59455.1 hypothetical protein MED92_09718 [Oceanospirillum sp. MED92] [Neptuniibacter caesariensis]